jgi:hypothetical protein
MGNILTCNYKKEKEYKSNLQYKRNYWYNPYSTIRKQNKERIRDKKEYKISNNYNIFQK